MINEIDLGYPETLPTLNKAVLDLGIKTALVLHCDITKEIFFDRKNYFYPDIPKNFQITQNNTPIGRNGYIEVQYDGIKKNIEITGLGDKARVFHTDYAAFAAASRDTFDIVFIDPPYSAGLLMPAVKAILPLMSDYGTIVCEHPPEITPEQAVGAFSVDRFYRYGKVIITVYRKGEI